MKHVFIVDGHDMQQTFQKFADARKAALHAPWSNGTVYRHPAGTAHPLVSLVQQLLKDEWEAGANNLPGWHMGDQWVSLVQQLLKVMQADQGKLVFTAPGAPYPR